MIEQTIATTPLVTIFGPPGSVFGYLVTGPDLVRNGQCPAHWPLAREPYYLETCMPGLSRPAMCATVR